MANLIRTAKSGSDWTAHELAAYNIRVEPQDAATFFGTPVLPDPVLAPAEVLKAARAEQASSDDGYLFLRTLGLAMAIRPDEESAVVDFMSSSSVLVVTLELEESPGQGRKCHFLFAVETDLLKRMFVS